MYTVSPTSEQYAFAAFIVRANDYEEAANHAARRLYKRRGVFGERVTGDRDKSGIFQAYQHIERLGPGGYAIGRPFHLM